jgi:hypothetical protein
MIQYSRLDDVSSGLTIIDTSTAIDLPISTTMLNATAAIGSGTNAGAGVAAIGLTECTLNRITNNPK